MKSTLYDIEKHEVEQHLTWITRIARLAADFAKSKNLHMQEIDQILKVLPGTVGTHII
jgi:hypothetical protein